MYYLFLDAVWYQQTTYYHVSATRLLEVNAIGASSSFTKEHHLARRVRPKQLELISQDTLSYLNERREDLERGEEECQVLTELVELIQENSVLIVWKRRTYEVLLYAIQRNGIQLPLHQVTVVQEILSAVDPVAKECNLSFEKLLRRYHVKYKSEDLHCSSRMVSCLKKLYCSAKYNYKHACECNPDRIPVFLKQSELIHSKACPFLIESLAEENQLSSGIRSVWEGSKFCDKCVNLGLLAMIPENIEFVKVEKGVSVERYAENLCKRLHLNCTCATGIIFVRSRCASWRIYHNNGNVERVYHENYRYHFGMEHKRNRKFRAGFHQQQLEIHNLHEILWYIANHDKKFLNREQCNQR